MITGVNALTSLGLDFKSFTENLPKPPKYSMVNTFEEHAFGSDTPACKVPFDTTVAKKILGRKGLRTKDRATQLLFAAMEEPFQDDLAQTEEDDRPGLMVGTAFGSIESVGNFITVGERTGPGSVNPRLFANTVINSATGNANIRYGLKNHSGVMSTGFNSGLDALIWSCNYIHNEYLSAVFAVGLEELSIYTLFGMDREGCLSKSGTASPMSTSADGLVPGEGCGILLLEEAGRASQRGAAVLGEIVGYCAAFEPQGWGGSGESMVYAMEEALRMAGLTAKDIDFVVSDANGVAHGDAAKMDTLARVFTDTTPVTSYRGQLGESYGAAGALDVCGIIADMQQKRVSPVHHETPHSGCNVVTQELALESSYAMAVSYSVEGHCSAVIVKKRS
ncbi:beta-ketoacyl synthase N-terminal-like domain-containing protein [Chitinivibrio alkaliphilus]|uniref:3-oxoacyl-(Acyl carrier protein) synthase II n=1 Tax=Chitinivibrio alkaliphilus ACht1 TaxID=1313304 RepID=U7D6P0_9BACT|nr:beta-ketoacyl synthase N-terminal-like domain-containing protein [Chitinivibrio alkaliphilus]ERP32184.1 3-oxoacyl-(acyl carrier protein) synthase II [Chitinivibrio alkaliphilus ACht1]